MKEKRKCCLVEQFKVTKGTIKFKINIAKIVDIYPKMMTSSVTSNFLKSYCKYIKNFCKEYQENFT